MEFGSPYNIALVKLVDRIPPYHSKKKAILRPCQQPGTPFKYGTVIGLGWTNQYSNSQSKQLMQAKLKSDENCGGFFRFDKLWNGYQLCYHDHDVENSNSAYNAVFRASISKSDIGGPLLYRRSRGRGFGCIIGVANFAVYNPNFRDFLSVFTSTTIFYDWILLPNCFFVTWRNDQRW